LPVAGAGPAADPGRRRGRQFAIRQQQRLLPGQSDRLGRLGTSRPRGRGPHRLRRTHDIPARKIPANPQPALARRTASGRLLRRVVAHARGRGDEGRGLEVSGRKVSRLRARSDGTRASPDLYRAERGARGDRVQTAEDAGVQELAAGAEHHRGQAGKRRFRIRRRDKGPAPIGAGFCGRGMSERRFGATLNKDGTTFRLWAPAAKRVDLVLEKKPLAMRRGNGGWYSLDVVQAGPGARYKFRIDDEIDVPDPASAFQPEDVMGPSEVIDQDAFAWRAQDWRGRPWTEAVFIETHVGTFTEGGSYRAMIDRLDHLANTGITALELMPLADFAGRRGWGYDGVLWYAPDSAYGRPEDLKTLIDEAHRRELMVFLDVVYNHFGPEGNFLGRYAPGFFTDAHTPWGSAIDYRVPEVRAFAIENALYWLRDYRFDGLRLDAANHIFSEPGQPSMLHDLSIAAGRLATASG